MSETYSNNNPQPGDSERQLLVKILTVLGSGGSSSGIQGGYGNYAGGEPTFTPAAGTLGIAVDTSYPTRIWWWYGSWN
jgi:hypothetical protein